MTAKKEYTIKARSKTRKLLITEHATGYVRMLAERTNIHHILKRAWYRITVDEKGGEATAGSAPKTKKLALTVKRNSSASASRGYDVYSIYEGSKQYNEATYRKRGVAQSAAKDHMAAHNSRLGVLKQTSI